MYFDLAGGTRVLVRPIEPGDKERLSVALSRLSSATIHKRFLAAKPRFSSAELRYLTEVDGRNHIALVAVPAGSPEDIVGVARCVRLPDAPDTAEFAVVVGDPFQGQGLGRRLTELLADAAREAGIRRFAAIMAADNEAARRLMGTFARRLDVIDRGVRDVVIDLAA